METDLMLGESDFDWNVNLECIGKKATVKNVGGNYDGMKGIITAVYRSEPDLPIDAYWLAFDNPANDLWFLPDELEIC